MPNPWVQWLLLITKTELHHSVIQILEEHGIEMPNRQLDVHLHSAAGQVATAGAEAASQRR